MGAELRDDDRWQATYDARQRYFEKTIGPLPNDILKMLNMMGVWPGGGLFVIPALKVSDLLTAYTTFGFTNPDMPTSVQRIDNEQQSRGGGRVAAQAQFTLTKKTPVATRPGAAGYGYEICVVAEPDQQWPLGFLQWAVNAEICQDVGLLARVEEYGGLTVEQIHVGGGTAINVLIAKARAPWPIGTQLPYGKMEILIATTITDEEMEWSMENDREALLKKLEDAHIGQISLPGRDSVIPNATPSRTSPLPDAVGNNRAQDILQDMATILFHGFVASMGAEPWQQGYADIRHLPDEPTMISKARLALPDGSRKSPSRDALDMTEVRDLFEKLWDANDPASPHRWYGLKITVHPDGQSQIEFNYDPDCAVDPAFFDN